MSTDLKPNTRILVVDDNTSIHEDFREILCPDNPADAAVAELETRLFEQQPLEAAPVSFELDSAFQGQEALAMVKESLKEKRPYSMAFVDVRMPPGWDGVETIGRIWEVYPALQIVVCTAYADYSWEEMRAKVGQPDSLLILKKPFDNIEVQQLAHALTKKWWLNRQAEQQLAELARTNASLALSEERFSKAFNESPLPGAIQSFPEQRFVAVNARFLQAIGCARAELIGRTPAELFLWEKPGISDEWFDMLARTELIQDQPARLRNREGKWREMLISLSRVAVGGKAHALLMAQDISERVLLEQQLRQAQKMEAIGQLAAGVAHDFNNILTVIQGHAGLLQQQLPSGASEAKSAAQISRASNRAATLIRQLLIFSRKQVMEMQHLDLNEILDGTTKMLERLVGEQVELEFCPQEPLLAIHADRSMVEQIAMNLAVNARDAMPKGGKVTIITTQQFIQRGPKPTDLEPRKGNYICLTFRDTGIGMPPQVLSRLFEPFFTTKPPGQGTGLGLCTVMGIVRQHNGWLDVESQPGQGTTFRIYFPASNQPPEKPEPATEKTLCGGKETILVAEDEEDLRQMVVHALKTQGYTVLEAASGVQALELWEQNNRPVDLLLTDVVMPGGVMGGDLAERLTTKLPSLKVIYTSGYSPGVAGKNGSIMGARNFLAKPYSIGKLAQFVRDCLDAPVKQN